MADMVAAYLDHYLDGKTSARSAVMLQGPWGAGKTHFIKGYMAERERIIRATQPGSTERTHLYVSLYGVKAPEEVHAQVFAQLHPNLNSGAARLIGGLASRAINAFVPGGLIKDEDAEQMRQFLGRNIGNLPLVFDDLERCAMPINDMMGFINSFVEHEGAKVLVLASEDDIPDEQKADYLRRKEKLIGKTLAVKADPNVVYDIFARELTNPSAKAAVVAAKAAALRVFAATGTTNYRSLRSVLEDFDRLVATVDRRLAARPEALQQLLLFMIATGVELRAAALTPHDIARIQIAKRDRLYAGFSKRDQPQWVADLSALADKYEDVEWADSIVPPEALASLFTSGAIETDAINEVLAQHPMIVGRKKAAAWRVLWGWARLTATEYQEARTQVLADLAKLEIRLPGAILHAAGTMLQLRKEGDDLLAGQDLVAFFRDYVERLIAADRFIPAVDVLESIDRSGHAGLGFACLDEQEFQAVSSLVDDAIARVSAAQMRSAAPQLLETLKSASSYEMLYEYGRGDTGYGGIAILHNIPVSEFADLAIVDCRLNERLMGALTQRYRGAAGFTEEGQWVEDLRLELLARAKAAPAPYAAMLERSLNSVFSRMDPPVPVVPKPKPKPKPAAKAKGAKKPTRPRKR